MYLMLLIYKNDLTENLPCIRKNSAENTSFFSKVFDKSASSLHVNNDLKIISNLAFQWKMQIHPDPIKQGELVTNELRVTIYCMSYELNLTYELRVTIYSTNWDSDAAC